MTSNVIVAVTVFPVPSLLVQAMLLGAFPLPPLLAQAVLFGAFPLSPLLAQAMLLGAFPLSPLLAQAVLFGAFPLPSLLAQAVLFRSFPLLPLNGGPLRIDTRLLRFPHNRSLRCNTCLFRLGRPLPALFLLPLILTGMWRRLDYRGSHADEQYTCQRIND